MSGREIAFVTGAGRGIGAATARALAKRGVSIALAARTVDEIEQVAAEIRDAGGRALPVRCDVTRAAEVRRAIAETEAALGPLSVLVNNAGVVLRVALAEMDEASWDAVVDTNLKGTFLCCRFVLPGMLARGRGRIVNVSSISGTVGTARQSAYCAAKWGVVGLTKALAEEVRGTGVVVSVVLPGSTDTGMLSGSGFEPRMTPAEVAASIAFLACDAPAAIQGGCFEMFG